MPILIRSFPFNLFVFSLFIRKTSISCSDLPDQAFILQGIKPMIESVFFHERIMRSFFRDIALLQHDDFITACHGAQFVGDNEHRFIFNQSADCLLDSCFIFRVYTGRAFIEQNHRRIFQKRPGNGKSLPLAAGKRFPVFADQGLIAIGKTRYKFIAGCQFCCCINFFFRCILFADFDVIVNRIVEQYDTFISI